VNPDSASGKLKLAGVTDNAGVGEESVSPPGAKPGWPGLMKTLCVSPGLDPAAVLERNQTFIVKIQADAAANHRSAGPSSRFQKPCSAFGFQAIPAFGAGFTKSWP